MIELTMQLSQFVKNVRHKLGMSQRDFAGLMGPMYTRAMIANYESGRAKVPGEMVFKILAGVAAVVDIRDCYQISIDPTNLKNWRYPIGYKLPKVA